jgi:hypothetical protein
MKPTLLLSLICLSFLAKSQQIPKSGNNSIFKKMELEETLPKINDFPKNKLKKEQKLNEQLISSTNIFKNKFYREQLANQPVIVYQSSIINHNNQTSYLMPILDTKDDISRSRIFEPSPLFKSNMPVGSNYSYW